MEFDLTFLRELLPGRDVLDITKTTYSIRGIDEVSDPTDKRVFVIGKTSRTAPIIESLSAFSSLEESHWVIICEGVFHLYQGTLESNKLKILENMGLNAGTDTEREPVRKITYKAACLAPEMFRSGWYKRIVAIIEYITGTGKFPCYFIPFLDGAKITTYRGVKMYELLLRRGKEDFIVVDNDSYIDIYNISSKQRIRVTPEEETCVDILESWVKLQLGEDIAI
jgi:hypothetical protein